MKSRRFLKTSLLGTVGFLLSGVTARAKTYLSPEQAAKILFPGQKLQKVPVTLTKAQQKSIRKASRVRVNHTTLNAYKTPGGEWLIYDEVIGKHENIDMAFAFDSRGGLKGMEVLVYRETYGHEVRNPSWKAQFRGKNYTEHLKLDRQIKNISGATLSCRHITDAVNRLAHTWHQVLRHL